MRLERNPPGALTLRPLTEPYMRYELVRSALYLKKRFRADNT
jgi:hypothetical protein